MQITDLVLQHYRSYSQKHLTFSETTVIIGPNTAGKSNLIESLFLLSSGKSFRAEKDIQMIKFGNDVGRVKGKIISSSEPSPLRERDSIKVEGVRSAKAEETILEVVISQLHGSYSKRFFVNNVARRRVDFMEKFHALLFAPTHLDIVSGSPSIRRNFLDEVLEPVDREYRQASIQYEKALRQRNALLHVVSETGRRDPKVFEYWDTLLITNGQCLTQKREEFIEYINASEKSLIDFTVEYDKSTVSEARLEQYLKAEEASGVTLVGPHRDDFLVLMSGSVLLSKARDLNTKDSESVQTQNGNREAKDFRSFGSRGQQRLVVLQLKLLQLAYMEKRLGQRPVLLLDDIFSELDDHHIEVVMGIVEKQQTIITTTHEEFLKNRKIGKVDVITLE